MHRPGFVFNLLALLIFTFAFIPSTQAQSTDRDRPTPLKSSELRGALDGSDTEYFYSFIAGPGQLTVTFDVKASATNAGANLDLFDKNSKQVLSLMAQGVDQGSERVTKSVRVASRQILVMRIKGISYGSSGNYQGEYLVRLEGAFDLPRSEPAAKDKMADDRLGLPTSGILRLEMSDGTTQEINLSRVQRASIKP